MTLLAYLGPGAALSGLGALIALLAAILVAILGFVWYPLKRLIRAMRGGPSTASEDDSTVADTN